MDRSDFTFAHPLRVRWAEVDRQDVVFNANYLMYFDVAVSEYWRAVGIPYPQGYVDRFSQDIFAVKASAEFHDSVTFDDEIQVCCRVSQLGRTSLHFTLGIWKDAQHVTSGELVYVNVALPAKIPAPWPQSLVESIQRFERLPPSTKKSAKDR